MVLNSRLSPALEEMHGAMQEGLLAQQRQVGVRACGRVVSLLGRKNAPDRP